MDTPQQQPVLAALEAADPAIAERLVTRRAAIARGASVSATVAAGLRLASVPVALAALSRDAFGQGGALPAVVIGVLNYALVLEELEYEFYQRGTDAAGLIPAADAAIFGTIRQHERVHRDYLRTTLGSAARPKPTFDFTAGNGSGAGPYAGLFAPGGYGTFTAVAQAFEDTGVRAYKGQAPALKPYPAVLTAALTIHSVEARHAAEVRRLRGNFTDEGPFHKGWITLNSTDVPGSTGTYAGEQNTNQGGVELTTALSGFTAAQISEAFDEPLTQAQVLAIVDPFLV